VTIDLMAGGRAYRVTVDPDGSGESGVVTIGLQPVDDDAPARVRRARVERTAHGVLLTDLADGRPIDAGVATDGPGRWLVQLPESAVVVSLDGKRRQGAGRSSGAGGERVVAPMPGRILRVLVAVGDTVEAGSPLVVIEAMKMENALSATRAGTVREVAVTEGLSVEAGRLLVQVE